MFSSVRKLTTVIDYLSKLLHNVFKFILKVDRRRKDCFIATVIAVYSCLLKMNVQLSPVSASVIHTLELSTECE